ncbi:flippase [Azoarcus sp. DN11]|uniref:flippase n=1 Tax=Azoarcus sp. DN11 TaxID=356837 RepID=UPI000EABA727|nr:flippase [Azoarcus sp. DN11]AYH45320.1 hypothetical protein CDA09_18380 [Azoarcus sp. DN11]
MTLSVGDLTSGRLLARSAFWNLVGMAAPMLAAVFAIPLLIDGMGKERFGLLAIVWMGVGYFSLFDLGLGRALTKVVSERLGRNELTGLGPLIWTAFALLAVLGMCGAALLIIFSPFLVNLLQVPEVLSNEATGAFRILAVGIPFVILTAALAGLLEAHQRFKAIAAIRVPLGVLTFAGPLVTPLFSPSIVWATVALLIGRVVAMFFYFLAAANVCAELRRPVLLDKNQIRPLLSFGGWLTVTNIVGPLMTYLDRFFVSAILGLSAVTYYVTPYEILMRMQVLPQAIMGVTFPAMSAAHGGESRRLTVLFAAAGRAAFWAMLPLTAGAFLLAPEVLLIWLGADFRDAATPVVRWLAAGCLINVMAQPAFAVLQASGRPDLVAKAHFVELVFYLVLLWWMAGAYGIAGVGAAWTLRALADTVILNALVARQLPVLKGQVHRSQRVLAAIVVGFAALLLVEPIVLRVAMLLVSVCIAGPVLGALLRKGFSVGLRDVSNAGTGNS